MTTEEVILTWREHANGLRQHENFFDDPRNGGIDSYERDLKANLIDAILDDIEASL